MKNLRRSNSDTNLFFAKNNIDIINYNLLKINSKSREYILRRQGCQKENSKSKVIIENEQFSISKEYSKTDSLDSHDTSPGNALRKEFQNFLIKIISSKISFDKKIIENHFPGYKYEMDIHFEIILYYIHFLKASIGNVMQMSLNLTEYEFKQFLELEDTLNSFDEMLQLFLRSNGIFLNRDVLRILVYNLESIITELTLKIKVIECHLDPYISKAIKHITTVVLIKLSNLIYFVHYYTIALNSLVDKLYRFLISCVKSTEEKDILGTIESIIKLKGEYFRDICFKDSQRTLPFDEPFSYHKAQQNLSNNSMFTYNKMSAFGPYVFNHLTKLLGPLTINSPKKSISEKDKKFIWKRCFLKQISLLHSSFRAHPDYFNLDNLLKESFNYRLFKWKCCYIPDEKTKEEKCRICKKIFKFNELVEHSYYCRERTVLISIQNHIDCQLCSFLQILNNEKDTIVQKMNIATNDDVPTFTRSNSDQNYDTNDNCNCNYHPLFFPSDKLMKYLEKLSPIRLNTLSSSHKLQSCEDIIDLLLNSINKEKQIPAELYEKHPMHIMPLNTIIHLLLKVLSTHQMQESKYDKLFKQVLVQLLNKQQVVTSLLTLKDFFASQIPQFKKSNKSTNFIESEINEILRKYEDTPYKNKYSTKHSKAMLKKSKTVSVCKSHKNLSDISRRTLLNIIKDESSVRRISSKLKAMEEDTVKSFSFNRIHQFKSIFNEESSDDPSMGMREITLRFPVSKALLSLGSVENTSTLSRQSSSSSDSCSESNSSFSFMPCTSIGIKRKSLFQGSIDENSSKENNEPAFNRDETASLENENEHQQIEGHKPSVKENISGEKSEVKNEEDMKLYELIEIIDDLHYDNKIPVDAINQEKIENKMSIDDFKFISFIGKGGFGYVNLYKKKDTGDLFAIKTCDISQFESKNVSKMINREMKILNQVNNDFLVKCYYIFADSKHFYYVMEYLAGGDLDHLIEEVPVVSIDIIKLIAAEMIAALSYLHAFGIIHKDIKPENILIGNDGHFKLADFGLSHVGLVQNKFVIKSTESSLELVDSDSTFPHKETSVINNQNKTFFFNDNIEFPELSSSNSTLYSKGQKIQGTPNYTAPETIRGEKATSAVDLWALGVVLYELFTNRQPFRDESINKIYDNILSQKIDWEKLKGCVGDDLASFDFIQKLLLPNPKQRLTNYEEIKAHPIFNGIFWDNLKCIDNRYIKGYVAKKIKNFKPSKLEEGLKQVNQDRKCSPHKNTFCTRRVDNLHNINMRVWKKKMTFFSEVNDDYLQEIYQLIK